MIEAKNISKSFGKKLVFDNADISVADGSICGLVGINGAGKSTLLRIIAGVLTADGGTVTVDGEPIYENKRVKRGLMFISDDPYFDFDINGEKLGKFFSVMYDMDGKVFGHYVEKFSLDLKKPLRNLSKGLKRQIFIAVALACRPKILLLDEAFDGLDPLARLEFKRGIIELQESGSTVVISSHSLRELEDICDSFILIDRNTVKVCGKIEDALDNIFKLQLVFKDGMTKDAFVAAMTAGGEGVPSGADGADAVPFECLRFDTLGRVVTAVLRGDKNTVMTKIDGLQPIVADEIPMDFEDYFIEEVRRADGEGR